MKKPPVKSQKATTLASDDDLRWYHLVLCGIITVLGATGLVVGIRSASDFVVAHHYFGFGIKVEAEHTPGGLVDLAIKENPAYIVLTPHRDLNEYGIEQSFAIDVKTGFPYNPPVYVCSPSIAVHAKNKWCIWSFGEQCALDMSVSHHNPEDIFYVHGANVTLIMSAQGYQRAYDDFTACIKEGNKK